MSNISERKTILWFTTPKELRRIAQKMEEEMPGLLPGSSCVMERIYGENGLKVEIAADQGAYHSSKSQNSYWS